MQHLDQVPRTLDAVGRFATLDKFEQDAYEFVSGKQAREAFDISAKTPKTRDSYGRHTWGQSALLARRLVEAGATFVTVHLGGWDHHWNLQSGMETNLPIVDSMLSALLTDLTQRGLFDSTLVMSLRRVQPHAPDEQRRQRRPAAAAWAPRAATTGATRCSACLAGGGIRGGQVIGSTDAKGHRPLTRPVGPENIHATVYRLLGIDPTLKLFDHSRPPDADPQRPDAD